jgi:hypothetical protein
MHMGQAAFAFKLSQIINGVLFVRSEHGAPVYDSTTVPQGGIWCPG